jgi:hypothetical protein
VDDRVRPLGGDELKDRSRGGPQPLITDERDLEVLRRDQALPGRRRAQRRRQQHTGSRYGLPSPYRPHRSTPFRWQDTRDVPDRNDQARAISGDVGPGTLLKQRTAPAG